MDHAHTGQPGDGHVLVMAVSECYAVRTRWLEVA
jgi:nitrogen regulatory protein PII